MTSPQPPNVQHQILHRQRSAGSAYSGSIPSDIEMRRQFPFSEKSHLPSSDLPPPPPTPPVSPPNSSLSQRLVEVFSVSFFRFAIASTCNVSPWRYAVEADIVRFGVITAKHSERLGFVLNVF